MAKVDQAAETQGHKVVVQLKDGAIPKVFPALPIPFPLKNAVEAEIDRLAEKVYWKLWIQLEHLLNGLHRSCVCQNQMIKFAYVWISCVPSICGSSSIARI